ncbi:hypothetical protein H5410_008870 [Solanum commersonii]|uniref:Uncharacterized protein n=1 Tax=Solanum commersonii TaxID=4109 RepID=A0A9J6AH54_SOLCO|nr:hypothetical protein H5410_008870 [Solanum commersonii]
MEALSYFSDVTGLVANMEKCSIFPAGVDEFTKEQLLALTGFTQGIFPIRYLGLPLSTEKWNKLGMSALLGVCFHLAPEYLVVDMKCRDPLGGTEERRKMSLCGMGQGLPSKERRTFLWVMWVHGVYMWTNTNIWIHQPPQDCSWFRKKINALKEMTKGWYTQGRCKLTYYGRYSITESYDAMLAQQRRLKISELIWTARTGDSSTPIFRVYLNRTSEIVSNTEEEHWKQFQKEMIATIWGTVIYHAWTARNWQIFRGTLVYTDAAIVQIKKEVIERLDLLKVGGVILLCTLPRRWLWNRRGSENLPKNNVKEVPFLALDVKIQLQSLQENHLNSPVIDIIER